MPGSSPVSAHFISSHIQVPGILCLSKPYLVLPRVEVEPNNKILKEKLKHRDGWFEYIIAVVGGKNLEMQNQMWSNKSRWMESPTPSARLVIASISKFSYRMENDRLSEVINTWRNQIRSTGNQDSRKLSVWNWLNWMLIYKQQWLVAGKRTHRYKVCMKEKIPQFWPQQFGETLVSDTFKTVVTLKWWNVATIEFKLLELCMKFHLTYHRHQLPV